jgi:hypothetical protein
MDKLEEHIRKHRDDLERYSPSIAIWKRIKNKIRNDKTLISHWRSIAAMFIVILGTAVSFFIIGNKWSDYDRSINIESGLYKYNPQLKETEIYYNNQINSLYREATPLLTGNPEIEKELTSDISHIDSICSEIKKDLKDNVANQDVIEALIQNYRLKIRLLEDMLVILKEDKNDTEKNKNHEI